MRSFFVLVALATSVLAIYIHPVDIRDDSESTEAIVGSLNAGNHFGAPNPPQVAGSVPGWYFGDDPGAADGLPWLKDPDLCAVLAQTPGSLRCPAGVTLFRRTATTVNTAPKPSGTAPPPPPPPPPPPGTYKPVFTGLTGAISAPDYMTYGLVDTVADCETMCDNVSGCQFINTYHDVNGKDGSPLLTCSLYTQFHTAADATNLGGQSQPDGSIDFITDSDGYDRTSGPAP